MCMCVWGEGGGVSRKMRCVCVCVCACVPFMHTGMSVSLAFCYMNCLQSLLLSFSAYVSQGG